jgi:methylmalonyl-CoA/ethylmalonyl-CoA epimerase
MPLLKDLNPHHFSIAVPDMDRAIAWYTSVLGFETEVRFHVAGIPADGAFLCRPELRLELWCATDVAPVPQERRTPNQDLKTSGTKHIAFTVADLQAHLPDLVNYGVDIAAIQRNRGEPMAPESNPLAPGRPPVFALFIRDPFGTLIELIDRQQVAA